jgi:head-tail adaptor
MISANMITRLRVFNESAMPDTAVIQRKTLTSDDAGGYTEGWTTIATVDCRVAPQGFTRDEEEIADRITAAKLWVITVPAGTDVDHSDRILVGSRTFEPVARPGPRSYEVGRRITCVEVVSAVGSVPVAGDAPLFNFSDSDNSQYIGLL